MRFRTPLISALAALLGACGSFGNEPDYEPVPAPRARLYFDAPALAGARATHLRAVRNAAGYTVNRARWDGAAGTTAELMLVETDSPKGLDVPDDPRDEAAKFRDLVRLSASFGTLYQSQTTMGPAIWRRFAAGDRSCVIFSQRWDDGPGTPVERTLFGYYCAAPGVAFSAQDAQAVLRHAGIR